MRQKLSSGSIYSDPLPCLILKVALRYYYHFFRIKPLPSAHTLNHTLGHQEQGNRHRLRVDSKLYKDLLEEILVKAPGLQPKMLSSSYCPLPFARCTHVVCPPHFKAIATCLSHSNQGRKQPATNTSNVPLLDAKYFPTPAACAHPSLFNKLR